MLSALSVADICLTAFTDLTALVKVGHSLHGMLSRNRSQSLVMAISAIFLALTVAFSVLKAVDLFIFQSDDENSRLVPWIRVLHVWNTQCPIAYEVICNMFVEVKADLD